MAAFGGAFQKVRNRQQAQIRAKAEAGLGGEDAGEGALAKSAAGGTLTISDIIDLQRRQRPAGPPPAPSRVDPRVLQARRTADARRRRLSQGRINVESLKSLLSTDQRGASGSLLGV